MQKIYLCFGVLFLGGEFGGRRFIPTRRGHVKYHCFGWFCAMLFIDSVTILCLSMIVNDYAMRFGRQMLYIFSLEPEVHLDVSRSGPWFATSLI